MSEYWRPSRWKNGRRTIHARRDCHHLQQAAAAGNPPIPADDDAYTDRCSRCCTDANELTGDALKRRRRARGLTQAELAARLGVARVTVSAWETERTGQSPGHAAGVRRVLAGTDGVVADD